LFDLDIKHQGMSQWLKNLKQQRNSKMFSLFDINSVTCQIYMYNETDYHTKMISDFCYKKNDEKTPLIMNQRFEN
jgi:predicted secreted protein